MKRRDFDLQGHRGARGLHPENTIEGFRAALAIGVTTLETDVAITADGVAVTSHDPELNPDIVRGPDGAFLAARGPAIRALTFAELARYDVGRIRPGSDYAAAFADQQGRDGVRIPRLSDVLALDAKVRFNVETKLFPDRPELTVAPAAMADAILDAADAAGALDRLTLQSFDWRSLRHARLVRPAVSRAFLTSAATVRRARLWWDGPAPEDFGDSVPRAVAAEGGGIWSPEWRTLNAEQVAEAHGYGLRVLPWTVNDPAAMVRLIGWGVDGLITDRPDLARTVMAAAGLILP